MSSAMKIIIEDKELELLYQGFKPKGKPEYQEATIKKLKKTIKTVESCGRREDLMLLNSLKFKAMEGYENKYSVRVDDFFRLEFSFQKENESDIAEYILVIRMSKHYK